MPNRKSRPSTRPGRPEPAEGQIPNPIGEGWEGVYGSPSVPDEFRALHAYSPVHNARPGRYPAILVMAGENDGRVAP